MQCIIFFSIICFHDNCGIIHVGYIYKIMLWGCCFFCNQIDRLKLFFNLFFFKLKRHEKISINKEFQFNVHISCLLNTAKERYLVDSYLQTHRPHPINKINFNISFFEHKQYKIYSDINRSPCDSTPKRKKKCFLAYMLILLIIFMEHSASFPCFGG